MKKCAWFLLLCWLACVPGLYAQAGPPLKLVETIPMPGVRGRIDHFSVDVKGRRLFVSALGNDTVEVIGLASGKDIHSIAGVQEPQGVFYAPESDRIFIANGGDGSVQVLDGSSYKRLSTVQFPSDADDIRYDAAHKRVYVGYGSGGLGVLDAMTGKELGTVPLQGHPEAFEVEDGGARIYVNIPAAREIAVADWDRRSVILRWPMENYRDNFPMAFDRSQHRLFVVCRRPAELLALDPESGKVVAHLAVAGDADDVYYDGARRRIYVSGGQGIISVVNQLDADHYRLRENVPTAPGARTSLFVPALGRLYLAVPHRGAQAAEIRVYQANN
ncbi:MAG: YncE family protein [Acidobacteria bacterium]|nr:MAG: YncE family protein [Acidobacteriota bacterium]